MSSLGDVVVAVLLIAGVGLVVVCSLGLIATRGVYDRLHYTSPASLAAVCIAAAIVVRESFSLIGNKALLAAAIVLVGSPVLVHVTARAARIHEQGEWTVQPDESIEVEEA